MVRGSITSAAILLCQGCSRFRREIHHPGHGNDGEVFAFTNDAGLAERTQIFLFRNDAFGVVKGFVLNEYDRARLPECGLEESFYIVRCAGQCDF